MVYEAFDRQLRRAVALKAVRMGGDVLLKEEWLLREAEAAAQLSHPNIVTLYDVGTFERGPYLVMELLRGQTLGERLGRGALRVEEALRIGTDVSRGVAHAHANGVIHRDLTAGNVFLCDDGHVKVLDFGMAQAFGRGKVDGGTMAYMAPEQYRGEPEDERTDVFALGVILYQMLAGTLPFRDARALESSDNAPALKVPEQEALGELVGRMLEKDPARRPRDGREVFAALSSRREANVGAGSSGTAPRLAGRRVARRALLAASGAVLLVAIAVALALAPARTVRVGHDGAGPSAVPPIAATAPGPAPPAPTPPAEPAPAALPEQPRTQRRTASPAHRPAPTPPIPRVRYCRGSINAVATPSPETGDAVLTIDADPFGDIFVNDSPYGETPGECRVSAGAYSVRVVHPEFGAREGRVEVKPGGRARWTADFLADR